MDSTTVIGLEVHVQLQTKTKLFCGCSTAFSPDQPNTQTCPVCLGLPGALPVMNRQAFDFALQVGLALNCDISPFTKWDRKQYYYPDLPKAYQISQYDLPFSSDGYLEIVMDEETEEKRRIGIIRAHLEEDAGKNLHDETGSKRDSKVDLNRCGTPLVEIVSEPDIRSPAEARKYLEELKLLLTYLDVSDCNMQEGSLRCDANINLHIHTDDGHLIPTPIVEIKNLNSFRNVELACEYQIGELLEDYQKTGLKLGDPGAEKTTWGFDANKGITFQQRGKEEAADYRYFPDPDLLPVTVAKDEIESVRESLCEFPALRRHRLRESYGLSAYDAGVIIDQGIRFADYYEEVAKTCHDGKLAANWVTQNVQREIHERQETIDSFAIRPLVLGTLLSKISEREITDKSAREVFSILLKDAEMVSRLEPDRVERIIEENGLKIESNSEELQGIIQTILEKNQRIVEDFRGGKQGAIGPLIGQVMKQSPSSDPKTVREMLIEAIR